MKRTLMAWMVSLLLLSVAGAAAAQDTKPATRISQDLSELASLPSAATLAAPQVAPDSFTALPPTVTGDWVTIDAVAADDPAALEAELIALGATNTAVAGRLVSARIPITAIPSLEGVASLQFAQQALSTTNVGLVTSQGDHVMRADVVRASFGLDGSGVKVGVLSDSFNCLGGAAGDVASGDLSPVTVLEEGPDCSSRIDEGRAMLQIVHDVAPGADLVFATAFTGQAGFANNIRALYDTGAKVIVDDVFYYLAPMFQDGVIAQAVDEVVASGVAYFSAAGNDARRSYDHAFVSGTALPAGGTFGALFLGGTPHVFSGTSNITQQITMPAQSAFRLVLQWDSPFFSAGGSGTTNDLDIYGLDSPTGPAVFRVATNNIASGDPVESVVVSCSSSVSPCTGFLMIVNHAGPLPGRLKYIIFTLDGGAPCFTPPSAVGGSADLVTVTGTNLRAAVNPTVKVGTTTVPPGLIQTSTLTELTFTVPLGAGNGKISVTTVDGTALSLDTLTVQQPPRATGFSPNPAPVGTTLTITGTNLTGVTEVTFNGAGPVVPLPGGTATSLKAIIPAGAVTGPVTLTNAIGATTSTVSYKLLPKIASFTPEAGLGSEVVVNGTNLTTGGADPVVKVGTVVAAVVSSSPTEVTFTVPALAVTAKITITTADGTATSTPTLIVLPGSVGF